MARKILADVRVVDMTEGVAGPYAATLLGDMGAQVVKVERREGDWQRSAGGGEPGRFGNPQFVALNRNKRDIGIDLNTGDGRRIVERLVSRSDVVVSNYRAGVMAKLGFSYERCAALKADIIYCTISGFGHDGPYAHGKGKTGALWAPDADAFLCDEHALGGATITLLYEADESHQTKVRVIGARHVGSRTTPIKRND